MRTIAIINQKGGCGKTTCSINLAAALAQEGQRTLLVDMDPQSHCALGLAVPESQIRYSSAELLRSGLDGSLAIKDVSWQIARNFDLIPSSMSLAAIEAQLQHAPDKDRRLAQVLQTVGDDYDFCVVDCPPSIGLLTFNALRAATEVVVPVETGYFSMEGAKKQHRTIEMLARRAGHNVEFSILPTMYDVRTKLAREILAEIKRHFTNHILPMVINFNAKLKEAASFGQPITEYDSASRGMKDFETLARHLISHPPATINADTTTEVVPAEDAQSQQAAGASRAAELVERARMLSQKTAEISQRLASDPEIAREGIEIRRPEEVGTGQAFTPSTPAPISASTPSTTHTPNTSVSPGMPNPASNATSGLATTPTINPTATSTTNPTVDTASRVTSLASWASPSSADEMPVGSPYPAASTGASYPSFGSPGSLTSPSSFNASTSETSASHLSASPKEPIGTAPSSYRSGHSNTAATRTAPSTPSNPSAYNSAATAPHGAMAPANSPPPISPTTGRLPSVAANGTIHRSSSVPNFSNTPPSFASPPQNGAATAVADSPTAAPTAGMPNAAPVNPVTHRRAERQEPTFPVRSTPNAAPQNNGMATGSVVPTATSAPALGSSIGAPIGGAVGAPVNPPAGAPKPDAGTSRTSAPVLTVPIANPVSADPSRQIDPKIAELYGVRKTSQGLLFVQPLNGARSISVAGDFNGWNPEQTKLKRNDQLGVWQAVVPVPVGRYRYRLVIDGQWVKDAYNTTVESNPFGELNNVIVVS